MKIEPIKDKNTRFDLVELKDECNIGRATPYCKLHGAMNKVSAFGYWRCLRSDAVPDCRAGCIAYENT